MIINTLEITKLLNEILDHQIANRGSKGAFYRCYTYEGGNMPTWVAKVEKQLLKLKQENNNEG